MKKKFLLLFLVGLYLISRLIRLADLPIFADEAIYIRWATMIFHDPHQYLFLPLYDGKTPLFIWLLIPVVKLFAANPLWGARLLSALFGLSTFFAIRRTVKQIGGSDRAQWIASMLVILLPYPLFHDRMGLIDSAVTSWLAWCFSFYLSWREHCRWKPILWAGVFWGLALMTKTTALYFLPVFVVYFVWVWWQQPKKRNSTLFIQAAVAVGLGLIFLGWMRISPLFPFLFRRSSDFAFTINDILTKPLYIVGINAPRIARWLWTYFTPAVWITLGLSLLLNKKNRRAWWFLVGAVCFILPFLLTGKLLASRYLLPSTIFIIPAVALVVESFFSKQTWLGGMLTVAILGGTLWFDIPLWTNPGSTPLTKDDVQQYLTEWSAGYGIPEVRDYLRQRVQVGKRVLVGTEGYFGTLPDGLFVYFSETPLLKNMEIIGVGQPIVDTPKELLAKAPLYNETYLVVNQNRLNYNYSLAFDVIHSYAKPHGGAPLLLLRLKQ